MRVLAAFDKFKGTATSAELGEVVVRVAHELGAQARAIVLSDGGEGLLDVFDGPDRTATVTGPRGLPVPAAWRLAGTDAVIESARASGLVLAGGAARNDPMTATSAGTGELIELAVTSGARQVVVGLGGSACTDGGLPAVAALGSGTLRAIADGDVSVLVCCDVTTRYEDAAAEFAPQKGATPDQVRALRARLASARAQLRDRFGVDVGELTGAGAAGGLAGALAAAGAQLRPGFDVVAERIELAAAIADADLVVTGEGRLDHTSFDGKVVGGVLRLARDVSRVDLVVGDMADDVDPPPGTVSLVGRFGHDRAMQHPLDCVEAVTRELLSRPPAS